MSTVITIISKNAIKDIHSLLLELQTETPKMLYRLGEDEQQYKTGFLPDVFMWIHQKSTRFLDWTSKQDEKGNWQYKIRIPVCSNCPLWQLGFAMIEKIVIQTAGNIYTEDMLDVDGNAGMNIAAFQKWKAAFSCENNLASDVDLTISMAEFKGDVTIFGMYAPFTFNKNINAELKTKRSPAKEFEKRMLQLQNACLDEAYSSTDIMLAKNPANGIEYKIKVCNGIPFTLFINDQLDFIGFTNLAGGQILLVPAKKVREVMPDYCFFDEYSFYVDNPCYTIWDSILEKASALNVEI